MSFYCLIIFTAKCDDGDVRLYQGPNEREGYVLVCINKRWGPICGDDRRANNVKTLCTQLGYMDGEFVRYNFYTYQP